MSEKDQQTTHELARDLGFLEAYTMGVGTMIGAGIFVLPSIAAANAGPASMISFVIGGIVSLLAALSLSELATGMPRAGGSYYYVNRSMGTLFGSIVGWGMWSGLMFATAFYMLGFGQYMTYFWEELPVAYAALTMAAILVAINFRGVKEAGAFQNLIVVALLGLIILFVTVGVFEVDLQTLRPFNPEGWGSVAAVAATLYVSFIGFEVIATSAEEIKEPGKTLPLAMIASVLTPMALYVLVMFVSTGVLPIDILGESTIPVADVAAEFLGKWGTLLMVIGAVLATVSSANASILSAARVNFAMGRDRILTNWLNEIHDRFYTPYRAILVTGAVILAMIGLGLPVETLADVASFSYLVTYALVHLAVIVMRRAAPPDYDPEFRLPNWAYPWVPLVGFVSCVVIALQMRPVVLAIGAGVIVVGVLWFVFYARSSAQAVSLIGDAIAGPAQQESTEEGGFRVVVPVANPKTEEALIRLAAACAVDHREPELVVINVIEVPMQTALEQNLRFEEERVARQQELLSAAADIAGDVGVKLRTRAILARSASEAIVEATRQERADRLMLGWAGEKKRRNYIFGSTIDEVVSNSPCEISLVKSRGDTVGDIVVLAGGGTIAPLAARQAYEVAQSSPESRLTLVNVQPPEQVGDPEQAGRKIIDAVATMANIPSDAFAAKVLIADDVEEALLSSVADYDTVFVGATREGMLRRALFGSIPEKVAKEAPGTVVMVNKPYQPRTIVEALAERLGFRR